MNYLELYIMSVFDATMISLLIYKLFNNHPKKMLHKILLIAFIALGANFIGQMVTNSVMSKALIMLFTLITFYMAIRKNGMNFSDYALGIIMVFIITYSIQVIIIIGLTIGLGEVKFEFYHGLIAQTSALVAVSVVIHYLNIKKIYNYINYKSIWLKFILITSMTLYLTLSFIWDLDIAGFLDSIVLIGVVLLIILTVNAVMIQNAITLKKDRERLAIYETYLPVIDNIIDEIKIKQHDYHNQIMTIAELKGEYKGYVHDVTKRDIWDQLILIDNKVLMAFLYSKYKDATEQGLIFDYKIESYAFETKYTDYELVEMFGILIDNAIEAAVKTEKKIIQVTLEYKEGMNCCKVENSVANFSVQDIPRMFDFYVSKKGEGRGIGLSKLKQLLDKEKGTINVFYDTQLKLLYVDICFN